MLQYFSLSFIEGWRDVQDFIPECSCLVFFFLKQLWVSLSLHHSSAEECWECDCHEFPEWSDWEISLIPALPSFLQNVQGGGMNHCSYSQGGLSYMESWETHEEVISLLCLGPTVCGPDPKATFRSDGLILRAGRKLLAKQHIENTGWMEPFAFIHLKNACTEMNLF